MIAVVSGKQLIAENTLLLTLDLRGQDFSFMPGEYLLLKVINPRYEDSRNNRRYFSITSAPREPLQIATRLRDSGFKKNLAETAIGEEVEIQGPWGDLILPKNNARSLVFLAGGMGITPFRSILRFFEKEGIDQEILLMYFNHKQNTTAFAEELGQAQGRMKNFKVVFSMTNQDDWVGERRKIGNKVVSEHIANAKEKLFLVAGPPMFVNQTLSALQELSIPPNQIIYESYTGYES